MKKPLHIDISRLPHPKKPSITKQLEAYLPDIEKYLSQGVPRKIILEHLNGIGFDLSLSSFETMLKRIRKRQKETKALSPTSRGHALARERSTEARGNDLYTDRPRKVQHDVTKPVSDW